MKTTRSLPLLLTATSPESTLADITLTTSHAVQPLADSKSLRKRHYQPPTLRHFGSVAELTQASSGPCYLDGMQGFCIMANMARDA